MLELFTVQVKNRQEEEELFLQNFLSLRSEPMFLTCSTQQIEKPREHLSAIAINVGLIIILSGNL